MERFEKTIAFIAGSGLAQGLEEVLENVKKVVGATNEDGEVLTYYVGNYKDLGVIILPRHGDSINDSPTITPNQLLNEGGYKANIRQLYNLGVEDIYALSAVGAIDNISKAGTGTFIVPDDYIPYGSVPSYGSKSNQVHNRMNEPFNHTLRGKIFDAIDEEGGNYLDCKGTYLFVEGDAFESKAQIRTMKKATKGESNRVVGMTTIPELLLSHQLGMNFAAICSNVNRAEGLDKSTIVAHETTMDEMEKAKPYLINIVTNIIKSY